MNWNIALTKGWKGLLTVLTSVLVSYIPIVEEWVAGVLPAEVTQLTIVGLVGFLINTAANYLKHKNV